MTENYFLIATMDISGRLIKQQVIKAETWLQARNQYQKKYGGEDYEILVKKIKIDS